MVAGTKDHSLSNLVIGFAAAAIAVVTVHQAVVYLLAQSGVLPPSTQAWSMRPIAPFSVPTIFNNIFWGGLWGALFAVVWPRLPGSAMWQRGLVFGLAIVVVSNWLLLPFVKGIVLSQANQAFFAGFDPKRMLATVLIVGGFGLTLGVIYGLFRSKA